MTTTPPPTPTTPLERLVPRSGWGAAPPIEQEVLNVPISNIICTYTGTPVCLTNEECVKQVKDLQTYHMESQQMPDIMYNFVIGGDGKVYEGRGWTTYSPPALKGKRYSGLNYKSINVSMVGDFKDSDPPENMSLARKELIEYGKEHGYIDQKTAAMWHGF